MTLFFSFEKLFMKQEPPCDDYTIKDLAQKKKKKQDIGELQPIRQTRTESAH